MEKMNFIKTRSHETAQLLIKEGFTLINNDESGYTFLNNKKLTMEVKKDINYVNNLNV